MKTANHQPRSLVRTIEFNTTDPERLKHLMRTQWLVTNGLGGFASGTISGMINWRYHGLLIAALPAPFGRISMLSHLAEYLRWPDGSFVQFGGDEPPYPEQEPTSAHYLEHFRLENHLPFWRYRIGKVIIEKRLVMPYFQNTVHLQYQLLGGADAVRLELRPAVHLRPFEAAVNTPLTEDYEVRSMGSRLEVHSREGYPPLRLFLHGVEWSYIHEGGASFDVFYERDAERGYESRGLLWTGGYYAVTVTPATPATLIASTEDWHTISALDPESAYSTERDRRQRLLRLAHPSARSGPAAELVLAADQFIISPAGRVRDAARARAAGDELRSVIAGYHWFTDWGRDTMISLEGLTLVTGRFHEAAWILRAFAHYVRDGLVPNMFPEGQNEGLYHTADATLWFFQALHRYVEVTGDIETLQALLPVLKDIIHHHLRGTRFGIGIDPEDDLLRQGAEGYQLTWMDAKVGGWVVTPRRGKAVEINALWYNAVRLMEDWLRNTGETALAEHLQAHARRTYHSFNRRFWNASAGYLFDVIDGEQGDDPALRPNQILAMSLAHPILAEERWPSVLRAVQEQLLTPVGLRSLGRMHPDYKTRYFGDLRARDAAYHQGTVWAWLIGPFIDAWLRVHPKDKASANQFLQGFISHLNDACVGSINEVFDAEPPYTPRGCIAQAWSVAEVLRCLVLTNTNAD